MKKFLHVILAIITVFSVSSCAIHSGLTGNLNNNITNVVLQDNNYKIIQKVKGEASGMSVFGILGGSFRPLVEKARSQMLESANLIGKSRAIINETVEVNNKFFVIVGFKTVTVSAYVIEFTDATIAEGDGAVIEKKAVIENITGKWISKRGDFEITINDNVGILSQINSGDWMFSLKKGIVNINNPIFKDITKKGDMTWECQTLTTDGFSVGWISSSLTLDVTGNKLTVSNKWEVYTLSRVKE